MFLNIITLLLVAAMVFMVMVQYERKKIDDPSVTPLEVYKELLKSPTLFSRSRARDAPYLQYGDIGDFTGYEDLSGSKYYRLHGLPHEES